MDSVEALAKAKTPREAAHAIVDAKLDLMCMLESIGNLPTNTGAIDGGDIEKQVGGIFDQVRSLDHELDRMQSLFCIFHGTKTINNSNKL